MKKIVDKLINNIRFDKRYVLFSIIIVILGIITGALFIVMLKSEDKTLVIEYIESFFENLKSNKNVYPDILKNVLISNYLIIVLISIVGFTFILFPVNILILFYKSFIIGFCLSSFILVYRIKGLLISFIYIFPHMIINILLFAILTAYTLKLSTNMIKYIIKKKDVNMRLYFTKYLYVVTIFIILVTLTGLYETYISTFILKFLLKIVI